jgi:peptidoglycan/xylan/chitin deacetylase (PgdA/CDA1 family)
MFYKKLLASCVFFSALCTSAWAVDPATVQTQAQAQPGTVDLSKIQTKPEKGTVALTFDDGPTADLTPQVLAILKKYGVHATFFVMAGHAKEHPEIVKQELAEGNPVANHTIWHPQLTKLSDEKLRVEVGDASKIITSIINKPPVCLRPPFFATNKKVAEVVHQNGMQQVMGFMTEDYTDMGTQKLVDHVLKNVHSGSVLVFHDTHKQTVEALPAIIEGIKKKGLGISVICAQP